MRVNIIEKLLSKNSSDKNITAVSIGASGEETAVKILKKNGYTIIERNYRTRQGEIDIIAVKGRFVVFVEVKLRKNADFAEAREFVTRSKQSRIITTAQIWLSQNETELQPRFDVIEIYAPEGIGRRVRIEHIEDAFC